MSQPAKTYCLVLVVASVLFLAVLSRFSWSRLVPFGQGATDDCGSYNEAIQVAQDAARDYLLASDVETVALEDDITATLFKRTGIWTVKGFAACENSRKFRWVVILAYHPGGVSGDRWELVTVVARSMDKDAGEFSRHSWEPSQESSKLLCFALDQQKGGSIFD